MNELQTRILNSAREALAKEYLYSDWEHVEEIATSEQRYNLSTEATERAMEEQAEFFRWCCAKGITLGVGKYEGESVYAFPEGAVYSESKLYELWEEQKG